MPDLNPILASVLLSLLAGLGTAVGGLIAVVRAPGRRSFGFMMGITAGVMLTLAFHSSSTKPGNWQASLPPRSALPSGLR